MWMGGATSRGGNATQWGEANSVYDPEAAHIVLTAGIPITMCAHPTPFSYPFSLRHCAIAPFLTDAVRILCCHHRRPVNGGGGGNE